MPFWVYIRKCSDGSYCTGHADNLEYRIAQQGEGKIDGCTASRLPVTFVFAEQFLARLDALEMEQRLKGWSRKKKGRADAWRLGRRIKIGQEQARGCSIAARSWFDRHTTNGEYFSVRRFDELRAGSEPVEGPEK
jgi:predicted GIY-YIG superfamily endonuclease